LIEPALARLPEIAFAALTTGPTNLVAALNCRDPLDLSHYLTERLAPLTGITTMETAPIIRTVKCAGPLMLWGVTGPGVWSKFQGDCRSQGD
jgi:DNA-binding Lrp family transcriptional regulator